MKTNVTLNIDADLVREAEALATQRGLPVSRLLAMQLEELLRRDLAYDAAQRRAIARLDRGYELGWSRPATRDELHER